MIKKEILELIARAICDAYGSNPDDVIQIDGQDVERWTLDLELAIAAYTVMEAVDAMKKKRRKTTTPQTAITVDRLRRAALVDKINFRALIAQSRFCT